MAVTEIKEGELYDGATIIRQARKPRKKKKKNVNNLLTYEYSD